MSAIFYLTFEQDSNSGAPFYKNKHVTIQENILLRGGDNYGRLKELHTYVRARFKLKELRVSICYVCYYLLPLYVCTYLPLLTRLHLVILVKWFIRMFLRAWNCCFRLFDCWLKKLSSALSTPNSALLLLRTPADCGGLFFLFFFAFNAADSSNTPYSTSIFSSFQFQSS